MGKRPAAKMPLSQRAKQFAPFDALKGFSDAITNTENRLYFEERKLLSEDQLAELDEKIHLLKKNDTVTVVFYRSGHYVSFSGQFEKIDELNRTMMISGQKIPLADIIETEMIKDII